MTSRDNQPGDASELRRRAEERAREIEAQFPENLTALSHEETRQVIRELRVHQIELELLNEEMHRTLAASSPNSPPERQNHSSRIYETPTSPDIGKDCLKLELPCDLTFLPVVQMFLREAVQSFGFPSGAIGGFGLAVDEAVTNVIEHAYEGESGQTFSVLCRRLPVGIEVLIHDRGIPFDPKLVPEYDPKKLAQEDQLRGLGTFLIHKFSDAVTFRNLGARGKEASLVKHFTRLEKSAPGLPIHTRVTPPGASDDSHMEVRRLRREEAIYVSRCAYDSHGYTFFDDHIYDPDRIIEQNESGMLLSAVAMTPDGDFMGHAALRYPYPGARIAELTYVFVNRDYRGHSCMNRLLMFLCETPKQSELCGIYGYAVTNHIISQKGALRMGLADCGLLLAASPASWQFRGLTGGSSQRISVVLHFKYLKSPEPRTLYPPARHRAVVERLYGNIGFTGHHFESAPAAGIDLQGGETRMETLAADSEGCAEVRVFKYGPRAIRDVRRKLRELCLAGHAATQLLLPLQDPATHILVEDFEEMGFFFAGILPDESIGDALILQYLNNVPFEYGQLAVHSECGRELIAYIKGRDPNENLCSEDD